MIRLKVGIIGLGSIAQKAWLPVVTRTEGWQIVGAFSPNQHRAGKICESYRIPLFSSAAELAAASDAVFVHTTTASHFSIVKALLMAGVDVCVDKPLAGSLDEAEQLVDLAHRKGRKLMVAFNRRFAPRYLQLKAELSSLASLRMDKHRCDSVGPHDLFHTLLDDYLHVVDTALWLGGGQAVLQNGTLQTNGVGEMMYAEHHFRQGNRLITTSMHRRAGTQRETVRALTDGSVWQIDDMCHLQREMAGQLIIDPTPAWQSTLEQRGFVGAVRHFIDCVQNQTLPQTSGEQALMAQRVVEKLWRDTDQE
ncbi:Gfo/Idh/MocA family protein [Erwinia psidii]|uniref:Gfo/Idh/MocA family oxidoreductase n=1 Tax=Erwinia psidii TaxID=69224 RepID=A0A3N6UUN0_9GAMM|nr:Gfo/Idh/MocA family oxidoreductase [Erwinia psidii]MCX8956386.1 gfo/Idh/MocA family oxidoreductase [Erwinia psidii]MCX8966488.1 gfo/Idh/MocA family oxidoreductase [Erwinia psidii]RQM36555.1 gfo/Idh/MocA family oxidoreductase [Erwinia psidii]